MLDFEKLRVFFTQLLLQLITLDLTAPTDLHQRGEPEGGRSALIDDDVGIDLNNRLFASCAFYFEHPDNIVGFYNSFAEQALYCTVAPTVERVPGCPFNLCASLSGQLLEFG